MRKFLITAIALMIVSTCSASALLRSTFYSTASQWNTAIPSNAVVDPNSAGMVQTLVDQTGQTGFAIASGYFGIPLYYANVSTKKYDIPMTSGYAGKTIIKGVPIPDGAAPDPGSDHHLMIVEPTSRCEYDLLGAVNNNGTWTTWWANTIKTNSTGFYPYGLAARASGFALGGGLILPQEIATGKIEHALAFNYPMTKAGGPIKPATSSDGTNTSVNAIPEGARIQVDPSYDLTAAGYTGWQYTVARALQVYGMYLADTGGAFTLYAQDPQSSTVQYPWGSDQFPHMPNSLVNHMRVIKMGVQFPPTYSVVPTDCAVIQ